MTNLASRPDAVSVEVDGQTAGLVIARDRGYRFYAADQRFASLEGHFFRTLADAEQTARKLHALLATARTMQPKLSKP